MTTPSERAEAAQHTDAPDLITIASAYEIALEVTEGDKIAAAILTLAVTLEGAVKSQTETIRLALMTEDERVRHAKTVASTNREMERRERLGQRF